MTYKMVGKNAEVTIQFSGDGPRLEFSGFVTMTEYTDTIDVANFSSGPTQSIVGFTRMTLEVTPKGPPDHDKRRPSIAEVMAKDVLRRDKNSLAAARALADMIVEDVAVAASGHPTRDELYARIDDLEKKLADANDLIQTAQGNLAGAAYGEGYE